MLDRFSVENFKAFKNKVELDLKPMTVLTGTNSSGKSSFTQALRMFQHIEQKHKSQPLFELNFDGTLSILGDFNSVRPDTERALTFSKQVKWWGLDNEMEMKISFELDPDKQMPGGRMEKFEIIDHSHGKPVSVFNYVLEEFEKKKPPKEWLEVVTPYNKDKKNINVSHLRKEFEQLIKQQEEFIISFKALVKFAAALGKKKDEFWRKSSRMEIKSFFENTETNDELDEHLKTWLSFTRNPRYIIGGEIPWWSFESDIFNELESEIDNRFHYRFNDEESNFNYLQKYKPDSTILDYKWEGEKLTDEQVELVKNLEKENETWYRGEMILPPFEHWSMRFFSGESLKEWKEYLENELDIKNLEIEKGTNYKILIDGFIQKGLEKLINEEFYDFLEKPIEYIPSIRAIPDRFVSKGNMNTYVERLVNAMGTPTKKQEKELNKWVKEFGIADKIEIKPFPEIGVSQILLFKNGRKLNLSDVGYGVSQLLPILLRLCLFRDEVVIIEEPETNLHPALQSKLADFFASHISSGKRIIVETHSVPFIRKLQYLVNKKKVDSEDTLIYYFHAPDNIPMGEEHVRKIKVKENGILSAGFGTGFTDEADNLAISLFELTKNDMN